MFKRIETSIKRTAMIIAAAAVAGSYLTMFPVSAKAFSIATSKDCDANAVVYCGASSTEELVSKYNAGDSRNGATSIQNIYSSFGISKAQVDSMNTTAVAGKVTKSGEVYVNSSSTPVATNAITAGRLNIAGSTQVTANGTTFYKRPPSVSFRASALPAFVVLKDGVFQYALLAPCGNPVSATPSVTKTPNYSVDKLVAKKGTDAFNKDVTIAPGEHVVYRITVKSTGDAPVSNLVVTDTLPAGVSYVPNTMTRDGGALPDAQANTLFTTGITVPSVAPGAATTVQFEAIVAAMPADASCTAKLYTNTARTIATNLPGGTSTADVNTQCVVAPQCTNLDIISNSERTVSISNFTYVTNSATFKNVSFNWGDGTAATDVSDTSKITSTSHTYAADGAYNIVATITFSQNGKDIQVSGPACQKPVSFKAAVVVTPVAKLVNTGPGATIAAFVSMLIVSTFLYRFFLLRSLNNQ